jgi:hypothetical protein
LNSHKARVGAEEHIFAHGGHVNGNLIPQVFVFNTIEPKAAEGEACEFANIILLRLLVNMIQYISTLSFLRVLPKVQLGR